MTEGMVLSEQTDSTADDVRRPVDVKVAGLAEWSPHFLPTNTGSG